MNIAGCKTVKSIPDSYSASSTGRLPAWFTILEMDGWMTPEKTNFRTPAAFAASTIATPRSASWGAKAGLM